MARDIGLEEMIRDDLREEHGLTEKPMFGGLAWLLFGNLLCVARDKGMLVRLGKGNDAWALKKPDIIPMKMGGRSMHGWVRAGMTSVGNDALRKKLLEAAVKFVKTLPKK